METPSSSHNHPPAINLFMALFRAFIDILFPPKCLICKRHSIKQEICTQCTASFKPVISPLCILCGSPFLTEGDDNHRCGNCIKEIPPFDIAASLFYYEEKMALAIQKLKYSKKSSLAAHLGKLLSEHPITENVFDLIIPVPLHLSRLKERGFNQSQLIAKELGNNISCNVKASLLERAKPTLPQVGMKRKERVQNVKGAFQLRKDADLRGKSILLIDDVFTTGATVRECSKILKKGGANQVSVLTLARVTS